MEQLFFNKGLINNLIFLEKNKDFEFINYLWKKFTIFFLILGLILKIWKNIL